MGTYNDIAEVFKTHRLKLILLLIHIESAVYINPVGEYVWVSEFNESSNVLEFIDF